MIAEIAYVGMDVHNETIAVSVASTGTTEPDYLGSGRTPSGELRIEPSEAALRERTV